MTDKLQIISEVGSYRLVKELQASGARVKGTPEVFGGMVCFPYDDYVDGDDRVMVFACERVLATAPAAATLLATQDFSIGDKLWWNVSASKFTNQRADGDYPVGRCRVASDLSAGVVAGSELEFELDPDMRGARWPVGAAAAALAGSLVKYGATALDGANPTSVAHGLSTCVAFLTQLVGAVAPGDNTSVLTASINGASVDVYAWKNTSGTDPTLVASSGTETFYWCAIGT